MLHGVNLLVVLLVVLVVLLLNIGLAEEVSRVIYPYNRVRARESRIKNQDGRV